MSKPFRLSTCARIAIASHEAINQVRKYTGEPYWHHCESVVRILQDHKQEIVGLNFNYNTILCAAWLHDVVEDTGVTLSTVEFLTNKDVANLVDELTYKSKLTDGNRKTRKEMDLVQTTNASAETQYIKCADILDNAKSIIKYDSEFAPLFVFEGKRLLEHMKPEIQKTKLWQKTYTVLKGYR